MSKQHMTAEEVAAAYNALHDENKELREALEELCNASKALRDQCDRRAAPNEYDRAFEAESRAGWALSNSRGQS
jgi:uncharacterized protein YukE